MFRFGRKRYFVIKDEYAFLFVRGVNWWLTGKYVRSRITGRKNPQIGYTINSRGRTGAAERSRLQRKQVK